VEPALSSLIESVEGGDRAAADALFAALYSELHRLARAQLARSAGNLTLGTTTLLHEAYLDLSKHDAARFPDRARFMAYAARAMRGLIIDYARQRKAQKRGGEFEISSLDGEIEARPPEDLDLTRINDALVELASVDPDLVQLVDLKFFSGFSFEEIAAMKGQSERTIFRQWEKARIYLHNAIGRQL
jgi:RNA polymerase sigma factor (TIGR02999 family)